MKDNHMNNKMRQQKKKAIFSNDFHQRMRGTDALALFSAGKLIQGLPRSSSQCFLSFLSPFLLSPWGLSLCARPTKFFMRYKKCIQRVIKQDCNGNYYSFHALQIRRADCCCNVIEEVQCLATGTVHYVVLVFF